MSLTICFHMSFLLLFCLFRFVLLASGLGLNGTGADSMMGLQLLVDMVTGHLGDQGEQNGAASISRVIFAGNLLSRSTQGKDSTTKVCKCVFFLLSFFQPNSKLFHHFFHASYVKAKYLTKKTQAGSVDAIRLLDELLVQLVVSISQSSYIRSVPFGFVFICMSL